MAELETTEQVTADVTTVASDTPETQVDITAIQAELEAARAALEATKESEEKWKTRAKRGKKKAKELIAQQDIPEVEADPDEDYDFSAEDKLAKIEEFMKVTEFKETFPDVKGEELTEIKKISSTKGLSYEDAYKVYKFDLMSDPQQKNISDAKRSGLDGSFSRPPVEADNQLKRRQELAKQRGLLS